MTIKKAFKLAARVARRRRDQRTYLFGAVGIRSDGKVVTASNLPARTHEPAAHAEARLARKLDVGARVVVVRITRDGVLRPSMPCAKCRRLLFNKGVSQVYYHVDADLVGVLVKREGIFW